MQYTSTATEMSTQKALLVNTDTIVFEKFYPPTPENALNLGLHGGAEMPVGNDLVEIKKCTPFLIDLMVYSPKAGFKFYLQIIRGCNEKNEEFWTLKFELHKAFEIEGQKGKKELIKVLEINIKANTKEEVSGAKTLASNGLTEKQSDIVTDELDPKAREIADKAERGMVVTKEDGLEITKIQKTN